MDVANLIEIVRFQHPTTGSQEREHQRVWALLAFDHGWLDDGTRQGLNQRLAALDHLLGES